MSKDSGELVEGPRTDYTFRLATRADLSLLFGWLRSPEVVRWWGDPEREAELLREDLDNPQMVMRIVSYGGRPFAYAQDYDVHAWPQAHLASLPRGSRAIDAFIGVPAMVGCGHGSRFLRLLAARLVAAGAPLVAIDPDADNVRAQRAYANAGFRAKGVVETEAGPAMLMLYAAASSTATGSSATDGGISANA